LSVRIIVLIVELGVADDLTCHSFLFPLNIVHTNFISVSTWSPLSLYCYRCVSTHPGCGTPFNWLWYWGEVCPEDDDKCVKIIERKGGNTCWMSYVWVSLLSAVQRVLLPFFAWGLGVC